jgi:hypothetical protein
MPAMGWTLGGKEWSFGNFLFHFGGWGPGMVISRETGDPKETIGFILKTVEDDLNHRFRHIMEKKKYDVDDVAAGREFIEAFIGWVVYSHHLYMSVKDAGGHGEPHGKKCECGGHS